MVVKYAWHSIKQDTTKIKEDEHSLQVPSILSKSGVYDYPDGAALKSTVELLRATRTARYAKLTIHEHPKTLVIMSQDQLFGGVINPFWDRNKMRATLDFDKKFTPEAFLQQVRLAVSGVGQPMDNSIGFYYKEDRTPGKAPDVNTGKIRRYDYIMRDIVIDHVAAGAFTGRCTAPSCGLGLDVMMRRVALDPYGKYKNMAECINANYDKKNDPVAHCAWLHKTVTGLWPGQTPQDAGLFHLIGDIMTMDRTTYALIFGDAERPPKAWMDNCLAKAQGFATNPGAFCGWVWHHGSSTLKNSFGSASYQEDKVVKRGSQWCVIHCSGPDAGKAIKCFSTKGEAEAMHRAIQARKHGALRVQTKGVKNKLSENMEEKTPEQLAQEFEDCVKQRMEEMPQLTREAAEAICMPATKPKDEPIPPGGTLDQQEKTPWQLCIQAEMAKGKTKEQARMACKEKGLTKTDQDAAFENCVARKMEGGMSREDAEQECRKEHPLETQDQEPEATELEKCIKTRMEATEETEEEARRWCEAELAGEHEKAADLIKRNKELLVLKRARAIRERKEKARRV